MLPFEDPTLDTPIAYGLTARARRIVASSTLPDLALVPVIGQESSPADRFDTRPARARALRRSGRKLPEIAVELDVDEDLAAAWTLDVVGPVGSPRGPISGLRQVGDVVGPALEARMSPGGGQLAAAALVLGLADVTNHAITLDTTEPRVAVAVARWLRDRIGVPTPRFRMLLAVGPAVARDVVAHRWAEMVGIPLENILAAPWPHAPEPSAVRATLRVADPHVAGIVVKWREALLTGSFPEPNLAAEHAALSFASAPSAAG